MDLCNCCTKCFRINGQKCGGIGYIVGRCGKGLKCNLAYATYTNPVGYCVPVLNPTTTPVQKLSTRRPFFATTLHDWVTLDQQSAVPRHDIPGFPINSVAENNPRIEQKSPENNDKYFVHSAGSWNMEIVNDHDTPRAPLRPKNATQNTTQTSNQKRQRTVNKASADDFISDISPAVIFVAVTGGVFLCLVGLLFLPTSQRSLQN
ncbi:uncharacterized protein [Porites lutea]|uniref:uncharacterized protein n=1 Tax=Porites lutea TaxID=51062 RepID=UPI003CC6322A